MRPERSGGPSRRRLRCAFLFCSLVFLGAGSARAEDPFAWHAGRIVTDLSARSDSLRLRLPAGWILPGSFRLSRGDTLLTRGVDYLLDPRRGTVRLLRPFPDGAGLHAEYTCFPLPLRPEHRKHELRTAGADPPDPLRAPLSPTGGRLLGAEPGAKLDISGSKTFAVEVGTNQDLALKQSLDLSVNGKVGRDVGVRAVLTDRNTPLQPDGTSAQLQDLDRVLVEVESPNARMTLGNFRFLLPPTEFGRMDRQLVGVRGSATPGPVTLFATGATNPGVLQKREFYGQEGKQGPYQLVSADLLEGGAIVAGSEHVVLDGRPLTRGEGEDYIIDYAQGTLSFTGRNPITAYSEISIDFQAASGRYRRSVYGTGVGWTPGEEASAKPDAPVFQAVFLTEGDDRGHPVIPLTSAQETALRAAGDDTTGLGSGIRYLGPGHGDYDRVSVDSLAIPFYRYVGPDSGSYQVRFDDVGDANGDYGDSTSAQGGRIYVFRGHKKGRFLPAEEVARPQRTSLLTFAAAPHLGRMLSMKGELALSDFDANTFSPIGDGNNRGLAFLLENETGPIPAGPLQLRVGGRIRQVGSTFHPLDRIDPSFYSRDWNVDPTRLAQGDRRWSVHGGFTLGRSLLDATFESLDNRIDFHGTRTVWEAATGLGALQLHGQALRARTVDDSGLVPVPGRRATEKLGAGRKGRLLALSGSYTREENRQGSPGEEQGTLFREGSVNIGSGSRFPRLRTSLQWTRRWRWTIEDAARLPLDVGDTGQWDLDWQGDGGRSLSMGYVRRVLRPSAGGESQSNQLGRLRWSERAGQDFLVQEGRWELSTSEQGRRIQEVLRVADGTGHYDSLGVYQGIGNYEVYYHDQADSARVNRIDFSLRNEFDFARLGEPEEGASFWERAWRSARLVHYWTAGIESDRSASYLLGRVGPALAGVTSLPLVEVQMRSEASTLPDARWFSPALTWDRHRGFHGLAENARDASASDLWTLRLRSRPGEKWTADQEIEWESTREQVLIEDLGGGLDGWRSLRLRLTQQRSVVHGLTGGLEVSGRVRHRIDNSETARVGEGTPFVVWEPRPRSRVELRTTRTTVSLSGEDRLSRDLERSGWNTRLTATLHLQEQLDLTLWVRSQNFDQGAPVRDGRLELRATF